MDVFFFFVSEENLQDFPTVLVTSYDSTALTMDTAPALKNRQQVFR